ncbi:hypothetical protein ACFQ6C_26440 [Streptomyces sp. NPDC056454]|uniref:hypothetical protein n=1 Tax=Streptomyces sp. NPDC056454 TaxID=3345823 RepID=UPI003681B9B1
MTDQTDRLEWPRMTPEMWEATRRQLPARREYLDFLNQGIINRVTDLREQWVGAGGPPLGVPTSRWWDERLVELNRALAPSTDHPLPIEGTLRERPGDQPLPTAGQESVQDALIKRIEERRELGIQRYGTPLQTFNGRNAVRDALEEALDLATYLMQVEMEQTARQAGLREALKLHEADQGLCRTCATPTPCATRQALVGIVQAGAQTPTKTVTRFAIKGATPIRVMRTDPVQEVACAPDAVADLHKHLGIDPLHQDGSPCKYMGFPITIDESVPSRTVLMRPRNA